VAYNFSAIIHVSEAGIEYVDEYEDTRFIDFDVCSLNAPKYLQYSAALHHVARRNEVKGWPENSVYYVEFFTEPPTKFVFDNEDDVARLCWRVEQMGWGVLGLS
jgi:hypothetical protein